MRQLSTRFVLPMLAACVMAPGSGYAALYNIYQAGLYDSSATGVSHVTSGGDDNSQFTFFNAAGYAAGTSQRYMQSSGDLVEGTSTWSYDPTTHLTTQIGLFSSSTTANSYTSLSGTQGSSNVFMNASGQVVGRSGLYSLNNQSGQGGSLGNSLWEYTPGAGTVQIGLYAPGSSDGSTVGYANTRTGAVIATAYGLNTAGQVVGQVGRYAGTANVGDDAFYYDPHNSTTPNVAIGLDFSANSANYINSDGQTAFSSAFGINNNGQATGLSTDYARSSYSDAFFYDPKSAAGSILIGLSNASYSNAAITAINNTVVAGNDSFAGNLSSLDAWIYNIQSGATAQVGLLDSAHVGTAGGTRSSSISSINTAGQAIGMAGLYTTIGGADTAAGSDAFFFNGTTTVPIGLTDAQHTANPVNVTMTQGNHGSFSNYTVRYNVASNLNNSGQVVGTATRFSSDGTITLGANAWYYSAATNSTVVIGLTDSTTTAGAVSHTSSDGLTQKSTVTALNDAGQAVGASTRYVGTTATGTDAYFYSPSTGSFAIGPNDALHTASDLTVQNTPSYLTASGLVAGTSTRYVSGTTTPNGTDVWLYDSNKNMEYTITPSTNTSTNYATATVNYLGNDGVIFGTFEKYSASGSDLGIDLYAYVEGLSIIDLGTMSADMTPAGWQSFAATFAGSASDSLAAYGLRTGEATPYGYYNNGSGTNGSTAVLASNFLLGDANLDGKVDLSDLNIVLNNLGTKSTLRSQGNFDGAATIDLTDLNDVLNNLGTSQPNVATAAVPEPASLALLAVGGVVLLRKRRIA